MEASNPELESFRQKWREEVTARARDGKATRSKKPTPPVASPVSATRSRNLDGPPARHPAADRKDEEEDNFETEEHDELTDGVETLNLGDNYDAFTKKAAEKEPRSALEHYEKAVERETQGKLGDSLGLYRKAYRVCFISVYSMIIHL